MSSYVLENQRNKIEASIDLREIDGRWYYKMWFRTPESSMSTTMPAKGKGYVHRAVALNEALQDLDKSTTTLSETQRQVLKLWFKQANRQAWEGISVDMRVSMYQDELNAR